MYHHRVAGAGEELLLPDGFVQLGGGDGAAAVLEKILEYGVLGVRELEILPVAPDGVGGEVYLKVLHGERGLRLAAVLPVPAQQRADLGKQLRL